MASNTYQAFLEAKAPTTSLDGRPDITAGDIHPMLFPHQRAIVEWALRGGRRAIFAAFGLGKSVMQLETLRLVTPPGARSLIICPLGVRAEFRHDAELLGIDTPVYLASELPAFPEDPDERLIALARHFGADTYLAGCGGRDYMKLDAYSRSGIRVLFQDYDHPVYKQQFGAFEPFLSTLDLLFNHGPESLAILRGKR